MIDPTAANDPLGVPVKGQVKAIGGAVLAGLIALGGSITSKNSVSTDVLTFLISGLGTYLGVFYLKNK